jgi:hypothetical protein
VGNKFNKAALTYLKKKIISKDLIQNLSLADNAD